MLSCTSHSLTDLERDVLLKELDENGFAVLPRVLPPQDIAVLSATLQRLAAAARDARPPSANQSVKLTNIVDLDPAFLELALYPPALQLSHDAFACGMFHINQSNAIARVREARRCLDFVSGSPWHADGPRPAATGSPFPSPKSANGAVGLHYLKFGFFFSDLRHGTGGSLQVVPGSHLRAELDGLCPASAGTAVADATDAGVSGPQGFDPSKYSVVQLDVAPGTIVVFHQAQWHAAMPNDSDVERLNAYISYCPTWMRPVDRDFPTLAELEAKNISSEACWLLGEPRPSPVRWWIPSACDLQRLDRFARESKPAGNAVVANYNAEEAAGFY